MNYSLTAKPAVPGPSIRYVSSPPEEITVRLGELKLPERLKSSKFDPERAISLRCAEVFATPQPSIDVAHLAEIAPEDIAPDFLHAGTIPINAALLALRFQFLQSIEQIEAPVVESVAAPTEEIPVQEPLQEISQEGSPLPSPIPDDAEVAPMTDTPGEVTSATSFQQKIEEPPINLGSDVAPAPPDIPPPPAVADPPPEEPAVSAAPVAERPAQLISLPPTPAPPPRSGMTEAAPADSKAIPRPRPTARIPDKRTIFNILPALRRQSTIPKPVAPPAPAPVEPEPTPEAPVAADDTSLKKPEAVVPEASEPAVEEAFQQEAAPSVETDIPESSLQEEAPTPEPAEPPIEAKAPEPEPLVSTALHTEHLPPTALKRAHGSSPELESAPDEGLSSQDRLQEIFMTEEHLTLEQVLKLCGGLPGIRSCILTKGSSVLSTYNVPDGIDLVSLTGNASAMLDAMRASSMRMGLGAIPAVTVHSEKGPVSFFHSDDLAMLIIHADRGFIPGVREKLHDVVVALGQSNLPLPLEGSSDK